MEMIYLDNNATTIVDPKVKEAMEPFSCQYYDVYHRDICIPLLCPRA